MAFTENEETKLKAIIAAFDNAQQVDDLPQSDMSATDKIIEVFDKKSGKSEQMTIKNAVQLGQHPWCGRVWNLDNATPKAAAYVGSLELLQNLHQELGLGCYLVKNDHTRRKLDSKDHTSMRLAKRPNSMVPRGTISGVGARSGTWSSRP